MVTCIDDDFKKIEMLTKGDIAFYEPGLKESVHRGMKSGRLSFTTSVDDGVKQSEIIFVCVGTPMKLNGEADTSYLEAASRRIGRAMDSYKIIVVKSTMPVKTGQWVKRTIEFNNPNNYDFDLVSNPEFLRDWQTIHDFMHADRILIGVESERAKKTMVRLYKPNKCHSYSNQYRNCRAYQACVQCVLGS